MQNLTEKKIRSFRKGKQNQQPNPASKKPLPTNNLVSPEAKLPRKAIRKDLCNLRTKTYFCSPKKSFGQPPVNLTWKTPRFLNELNNNNNQKKKQNNTPKKPTEKKLVMV